jgi:hypothetical protein
MTLPKIFGLQKSHCQDMPFQTYQITNYLQYSLLSLLLSPPFKDCIFMKSIFPKIVCLHTYLKQIVGKIM